MRSPGAITWENAPRRLDGSMKGHSLRDVWELGNAVGTFLGEKKKYIADISGAFLNVLQLSSTDILYEEKRSVFHGRTFVSAFCPPRYKDWSR